MIFEESGDGHGVGALVLHADAHGFDAANQEKRRARIHGTAEINDHVPYAVHPFFTAGGGAGDNVGMAGEILGGAVDDDVEAKFDRLLQNGSGESVVDDRDEIVVLGEGDGSFKIYEAQRGVGGRFDVQNFAARSDQAFDAVERRADVADSDAHVRKNIAHQAVGAAVELRGGDQFVALF